MLSARNLVLSAGARRLVDGIDLDLSGGEVLAIAGPNGAGKSSLLKLLGGEVRAEHGEIRLGNLPLTALDGTRLARQRAVLPQLESLRFAFSVTEVIRLGRHPWAEASAQESAIVDEVMAHCGVAPLASRNYLTLSGGERARVQLARVLAQLWPLERAGPRCLMLDEPTASLDLAVQASVLSILRKVAAAGVGVIVVLHDLNQVMQVADRVLLMRDGRRMRLGAAADVLQPECIRETFGVEVELLARPGHRKPWIAMSAELG